jgi:hypothetical protein
VLFGDSEDRADHAPAHLCVRLAVIPAFASLQPTCVAIGEARFGLGVGQSRPGADVDLAQVANDLDAKVLAARDDRGSLACPLKIARVHRIQLGIAEAIGECLCLLAAEAGEGPVGKSLPALRAVPVALAVTS